MCHVSLRPSLRIHELRAGGARLVPPQQVDVLYHRREIVRREAQQAFDGVGARIQRRGE